MTEVARWKTIATIAIAFSAGNLFATACGGEGGGLVKDAAANNAALEAAVAALQDDVSDIKCVLTYLEDANQDGSANGFVDEEEVVAANSACGI